MNGYVNRWTQTQCTVSEYCATSTKGWSRYALDESRPVSMRVAVDRELLRVLVVVIISVFTDIQVEDVMVVVGALTFFCFRPASGESKRAMSKGNSRKGYVVDLH